MTVITFEIYYSGDYLQMSRRGVNNLYSLYGINGQRKYLTLNERKRFYLASMLEEEKKRLFLLMLFFSGARISEVLNIKKNHIEVEECMVVIESLKKRRKGIYRLIPLPQDFVKDLGQYLNQIESDYLWDFCRRTASRYVSKVMQEAKITGIQASAKGLRHSFAVSAIEKQIPLNLIKKWMGHSSITTTEIYLNVVGMEERSFAQKMW